MGKIFGIIPDALVTVSYKVELVKVFFSTGKWYTVLLEYDKLPTDYVLTVVCTDVDDKTVELTLTYDDIQELIS